jgi:cephalosporin hydroxylase
MDDMGQSENFSDQVLEQIHTLGRHGELREQSLAWMVAVAIGKYSYNFTSLGRPIIQYPQDMVALQELIWRVRPDLIIETGIAHGGSLILSASMLSLLDYCDAVESGATLDPRATRRHVLGIDIDIRAHNRAAIEAHPMSHRITMLQGSSVALDVVTEARRIAGEHSKALIVLDSNHTHEHVLAELEAYAPLTGKGSYCCVFDTLVEDMPRELLTNAPWGKGNNPKTAVWEYLKRLAAGEGRLAADGGPLNFEIDKMIENKLLITVAPDGYLRRL